MQQRARKRGDFESFKASVLFCPRCKVATPAREKLLLILPDSSLYEYLCTYCGTSTGSRTEKAIKDTRIFIP